MSAATEPAAQAMPGENASSREIVKRAAAAPLAMERMPLMTDDEIRRSWRLASSLAASGMFKDAQQAEQAFAKILLGRDLGLTPTQAMTGIYIVEGKPVVAAVTMAMFVRGRDGYDYEVREQTAEKCSIEFFVSGASRGVSTFTWEDAKKANLTEKANYKRYPRNMLYARAMSNGLKWFVPEALNGIPVYVEGEIEEHKALGEGSGDGQPVGLDLGPDVEAVIAQAAEMGHAALSDRGTIEMQLGSQSPAYVASWVRAARKELDDIPPDASVVAEPDPRPVSPSAAQVGEDRGEADNAPQEPVAAGEAGESPPVVDADRLAAMKRRVDELLNDADALDDSDPGRAQDCRDEAEGLMTAVESAADSNQATLL